MAPQSSRRQFVAAAAGAAAWMRVARSVRAESGAAQATRAGHLNIGVASYSMREFTLDQALDMAHALHVSDMTFKDVHVPRTDPPETTRALRAKIEAAGITIMGGGTITIPNDPAKIKKEFEYARNAGLDRKSTRLNSSHVSISYAVFCLKKKKNQKLVVFIVTPITEYSRMGSAGSFRSSHIRQICRARMWLSESIRLYLAPN